MTSDRTEPDADRPGPGGTPEGHTPEAPAPDEFGEPGTPGAALTPEVPHPADAEADHIDQDVDTHEMEALGPIDWRAWAASLLGIAIAALIGLALALPTLPR